MLSHFIFLFKFPLAMNLHYRDYTMDPISAMAASGLRTRMDSLDLLANNLANASTTGYKNDHEFYSIFTGETADSASLELPTTQPDVNRPWTDFSQGTLQPTNNPLDVGLEGKGFLTLAGPSGPLYTRNGNLRVSSKGQLISSDGYPVAQQDGSPITLNSSLPVEITGDGTVRQGPQVAGQLQIVEFPDNAPLIKQGSNVFRNTSQNVKPAAAAATQVHQGALEASNVSTPESAVQLIGIMRQFESLRKAITLTNDMNKKAIEEVSRVGS